MATLYASAVAFQRLAWTQNWATGASHTVMIRALGTAGRPRVDLDAVIIVN